MTLLSTGLFALTAGSALALPSTLHRREAPQDDEYAAVLRQQQVQCKQTVNLGTFVSIAQCTAAALDSAECGGSFMWSEEFANSWGCRCCNEEAPELSEHEKWSIYSIELPAKHYETKAIEADSKYNEFKDLAVNSDAAAKKWLAIRDANTEAFDAWGNQAFHKAKYETHKGERAQVFADFIYERNEATEKAQLEYYAAQNEIDAEVDAALGTHAANNVPIKTAKGINDEQIITKINELNGYKNSIKVLEEKISSGETVLGLLNVEKENINKRLEAEIKRHQDIQSGLHDKKKALAEAHTLWKDGHEVEWNKKVETWVGERDKAEEDLDKAHKAEFNEWLKQQEEADKLNLYEEEY